MEKVLVSHGRVTEYVMDEIVENNIRHKSILLSGDRIHDFWGIRFLVHHPLHPSANPSGYIQAAGVACRLDLATGHPQIPLRGEFSFSTTRIESTTPPSIEVHREIYISLS